jgi:uncharacterized protein YqhQ
MLNLLQGCSCPQKTLYAVTALVHILTQLGYLLAIRKESNLNSKIGFFILAIVIAILVFKLIEYLCNKQYNTIAWILAILPLISSISLGFLIEKDCKFYSKKNIYDINLSKYRKPSL